MSRRFALISLAVLFAALQILFLTMEQKVAGRFGYGLDDSWIHATFARSLAEGKGFSFNPGEQISGSTAPLYTALLALWYAITHDVIWGGKILGIIGLALSALFLYLATERLTENRFAAWLAAALCVASPLLLWASLSGMEICVYLATLCAAFYLFTRGAYVWMTVMLCAGVWLRPESGMVLGLGWLALPNKLKVKTAIISAALLLPYFALNWSLGHYPFPATVRTKLGFETERFSAHFLQELGMVFYRHQFLLLVLAAPLGFVFVRRKAWWIAVYVPAFLLIVWAFSSTSSAAYRWLHPVLPAVYLLIAAGVLRLMQIKPAWAKGIQMAALVAIAVQIYMAVDYAPIHGLSVENITDMQVYAAEIVSGVTDPSDVIATNDVGAFGYFGHRRIVDLVGLVSPRRSLEDNLRIEQPVMVFMFDKWYPSRNSSPTFTGNYKYWGKIPLGVNVVCGDSVMTIYARNDRYADLRTRAAAMQR